MVENKLDYPSLIRAASFSARHLQRPNAWVGHIPFASWLVEQLNPKILVELGTHSGNSYFSFCQAIQEKKLATKCYAVDTWGGDEHAGFYEQEIYSMVSKHNQEYYAGFSRLLRMTFDEALQYFGEGSIELLHIDGLHTYEAVKHDFDTWLPKLAPGAVVLFHDSNVRENDFGVWKLWQEIEENYPANLEFLHSHGLGVVQVGSSPDKYLPWLEADSRWQKDELKLYFSELGEKQIERFDLTELNNSKTVVEYQKTIKELREFIAECQVSIKELHDYIKEREDKIINLYHDIDSKYQKIEALKDVVALRDERIFRLNEYLVDNAEQISDLNYLVHQHEDFKKQYEEEILNLNNKIDEYQAQSAALEKSLDEANKQIQAEAARHQENIKTRENEILKDIQNTRTWRMTQPLRSTAQIARRVRNKLLASQNEFAGQNGQPKKPTVLESPESDLQDFSIHESETNSTLDKRAVMNFLVKNAENDLTAQSFENLSADKTGNGSKLQSQQENELKHIVQTAAKFRSAAKPVVLLFMQIAAGKSDAPIQQALQFLSDSKKNVLVLHADTQQQLVLETADSQDDFQLFLESDDLKLLAETLNAFGVKKAIIYQTSDFNFSIESLLLTMQIPYEVYFDESLFRSKNGFSPTESESAAIKNSPSFPENHFQNNLFSADHSDIYWQYLKSISLLNGAENVICRNQSVADYVREIYPSVSPLIKFQQETSTKAANASSHDSLTTNSPDAEKQINPEADKKSLPTIALIPEMSGVTPSPCAYVRLILPLLSKNILSNFKLRLSSPKEVTNLRADIVVTNRLPCSEFAELENFLKYIRENGAKLIYDIDDNLLYLHDTHPEKDYYASKAPLVFELLKTADCVWISTKKLALHLRPYCKELRVIENYVNENLFKSIDFGEQTTNETFKILYMGTSSHKRDLAQVMTALRELNSQGKEIELHLIGINDARLVEDWVKIINPPAEARFYPNFMKWLKTLGHFDLGIAPLEQSIFNECKSDIKFWDYTTIGVPTLASDILTYKSSITNGRNGLLVENSADQWIHKISWAVENREQLKIMTKSAADDLKGLAVKRSKELKRKASLLKTVNPDFLKSKKLN